MWPKSIAREQVIYICDACSHVIGWLAMIWKTLVEFPLYEVSNRGFVRRVGRSSKLKLHLDSRGYPRLTLYSDGKPYKANPHILVAKTFLDWWKGCVVHHKDDDKTNNVVTNLVCVSRVTHASYHRNPNSLSASQIRRVRFLARKGVTHYQISNETGLAVHRVYPLLSGQTFARFEIRKLRRVA